MCRGLGQHAVVEGEPGRVHVVHRVADVLVNQEEGKVQEVRAGLGRGEDSAAAEVLLQGLTGNKERKANEWTKK